MAKHPGATGLPCREWIGAAGVCVITDRDDGLIEVRTTAVLTVVELGVLGFLRFDLTIPALGLVHDLPAFTVVSASNQQRRSCSSLQASALCEIGSGFSASERR
jgi:hypothetical protein